MESKMLTLTVIVNSYNRKDLLEESSASLLITLKELQLHALIIFIDAGSNDGSIEFISNLQQQEKDQQIVLLEKRGISFSGGCNTAAEYSIKNYPEIKYLLFYETDNFFIQSNPLKMALQLIEQKKEISAVGFTVEKFSGTKIMYGSRRPTIWTFALGQKFTELFKLEHNKPIWKTHQTISYTNCDIVYTSPLLLKSEVWRSIGGMDELFPFSDSDIDLCLKMQEKGFFNVVIQCNGVVHDNKNKASAWSQKRVLDFHKSRFNLFKKYESQRVSVLRRMLIVRHNLEIVVAKLLGKDKTFIENRKNLIKNYNN